MALDATIVGANLDVNGNIKVALPAGYSFTFSNTGIDVNNFPAVQPVSFTWAGLTDAQLRASAVLTNEEEHATYAAAFVGQNPANNVTDFITITGSATKTTVVLEVALFGTSNNATTIDISVLKRSSANTGGTSSVVAGVSFDSANAVPSAVVRSYTANPTLGTLAGAVVAKKYTTSQAGTQPSEFEEVFSTQGSHGVVLRGTSEVLAINLNSAGLAGESFDGYIRWIEF